MGAAPMGEDLAKQLLQRVPSTRFLGQRETQSSMERMRGTLNCIVYGMTETCGGALMPILDRRELYRRVGVPVSRTAVAIFDEQTGNTAKFGAKGEVQSSTKNKRNAKMQVAFRCPYRASGYRNHRDATAATFRADGWVMSGEHEIDKSK